jgi:hypothetical protein
MEISLEDIYSGERLSREATIFQATLFINRYKVGVITNDGQGGATMYRPIDDKGVALIREAEHWCRGLAPMVGTETMTNGTPVSIPMDLETYLDNLITDWLNQKDVARFWRKAEKEMYNAILSGIPGKTFRVMRYGDAIARLVRRYGGVEQLRLDIHRKVIPMLQENEKILNTNIPLRIVRQLGVPAGKWVKLVGRK